MGYQVESNWLILAYISNWRFKDFALGMHLSSQRGNKREYYLLLSLGFWQISVGFKL